MCGLSAALMNTTSMMIDPMAPASISGFRTLSRSDRIPNTIRATMSAHQNQAFSELACDVERLTPDGSLKTVAQ